MLAKLFVSNQKIAVQVVFVFTTCIWYTSGNLLSAIFHHREVLQANGCSVACKFFVTYLVPLPSSVRMNSLQIYCGKIRFCSGCKNLWDNHKLFLQMCFDKSDENNSTHILFVNRDLFVESGSTACWLFAVSLDFICFKFVLAKPNNHIKPVLLGLLLYLY